MSDAVTESPAPVHRFILLTDIAQSSRLAEEFPHGYARALAEHNQLIEQGVAANGGSIYKNTGDGFYALFETAGACVDCTTELATALAGIAPVVENEPLLVRFALHAGELQPAGVEYFGPALNRASRICQVCHPGQVLCSSAVAITLGKPKGGLVLNDLGHHHLRDLSDPEHLYQLDSERCTSREFPPLTTLENRPNNLVEQPNAFVGRSQELAELNDLLTGSTRLLSITAPGGYGKSRLAAQLCANLLHRFEHGVFMAYLAPARDSSLVPGAIAGALKLQFSGNADPGEQLANYLRNKELLLCLDNFEHVMDCIPLVRSLLDGAPGLRIVATSRESLRIKGEQVFSLQPLAVEDAKGGFTDAEQLFAERARLVKHGFVLQEDNHSLVRAACNRLSGIPLAIELAAAWMDNFTLVEMNEELSRQLELESRESDAEGRHQSLKACLDWSWNLLGEQQQRILMQLSTFRGGFFSEAAADLLEISGMKLRSALARLVDKSWLYTREVGGRTRYYLRDMLALEYAFEQLTLTNNQRNGEDSLYEQSVLAHARYFADLLEHEGPRLEGDGTPTGQLEALATIRLELDNIEEAMDTLLNWLSAATVDRITLMLRWLVRFLSVTSSFGLAEERCKKFMSVARESGEYSNLLLRATLGCGYAQTRLGDTESARNNLDFALEMAVAAGNRRAEAEAMAYLGDMHLSRGDFADYAKVLNECMTIAREIGDTWLVAGCLNATAIYEYVEGNHQAASDIGNQGLALRRELGDIHGIAGSLNNQGLYARKLGDYNAARKLYLEAHEINLAIGNRSWVSYNLSNLGDMARTEGDLPGSISYHLQSMEIIRDLVLQVETVTSLVIFGEILTHCGQLETGAVLLLGGQYFIDQLKVTIPPEEEARLMQGMAVIEHPLTGLSVSVRDQLQAKAEALSIDELAQFAMDKLTKLKSVLEVQENQPSA